MVLVACNPIRDASMTNQILTITCQCKRNSQFQFDGQDIFLEITITNNLRVDVGFPLSFIQKTGPVIKLIDTRTKMENNLKKNLADFELRQKYTYIQPGQSVNIQWVITGDELKQFGGNPVDVVAEITIMTKLDVSGKQVDFCESEMLRIVGKS